MTVHTAPPVSSYRTRPPQDRAAVGGSGYVFVGLCAAAVLAGLLLPDRVAGAPAMPGMSMTHYMQLLSERQPTNLLLFMALPVVLAETLAITELVLLFASRPPRGVAALSRAAGLSAGPVMLAIFLHLVRYAVVPLTQSGAWRGWVDVLAVGAYLLGVVPLMVVGLVESGLLDLEPRRARAWHVAGVAVFLVVAHVAMIAGMLDPSVTGWSGQVPAGTTTPATHQMPDGSMMPGMPDMQH